MVSKRKRLFMFRALRTNEFGLVRAYDVEEVINLVMGFYDYKEPIEVRTVPRSFKLQIFPKPPYVPWPGLCARNAPNEG